MSRLARHINSRSGSANRSCCEHRVSLDVCFVQLGDNDLQAGLGRWPEAGLEAGIPASVLSHSVTTR